MSEKKNSGINNEVIDSAGVDNKVVDSGVNSETKNTAGVNAAGSNNDLSSNANVIMHTNVTDPYSFDNIVEIVEKEDGTYTVFTTSDEDIENDSNPGPFEFQEVQSFSAIMRRNARRNFKLRGFDFDVDTFENLIDAFVEKETVPVILGCRHADLDRFCRAVYGVDYNTAYPRLLGIADMWMRKAVTNLATSGNATALGIASKHFMKLEEDKEKANINIVVVNDLTEEDV